ncbi:MAG: hypothetical protein E6K80_00245 [Candidatus Eisenbacteria bacterium]|uniref:Uncharacterized protein n=1 Tax=Eiseniibacteriota bacterium TaxID=2212470 RepID=A0A538UBU9_UNCEI|nr:MAG: hypothetical protein E6K80_00245 [Candidatus Eisenbacteria bacterium]
MLETNRREFPTALLLNGASALFWSCAVGVKMVALWMLIRYSIFCWYVPVPPASMGVRAGRAFVIGGYIAGAVWVLRKRILGIPS